VLQRLPPEQLKQVCGVVMRFELRQPWREPQQPSLENVRLYCTPIVNLFKHDAAPIRLDGKQDEYLLLPGEYAREHACVFSVDRVTGWHPGGLGYQAYVPFESFEHNGDSDDATAAPATASANVRVPTTPGSIPGWGCQRRSARPAHAVGRADLHQPQPATAVANRRDRPSVRADAPGLVVSQYLRAPTASFLAAAGAEFSLATDQQSVAQLPVVERHPCAAGHPRNLRPAALPRPPAQKIGERRLGALRAVSHTAVDRLYRGLPVRGLRIDLTVDPQGFLGQGEVFVFASVLNEFFCALRQP
jgi:type VI secretion system protein ImpG